MENPTKEKLYKGRHVSKPSVILYWGGYMFEDLQWKSIIGMFCNMVKALNITRNMKANMVKIRFMKYGMWEGLNFPPMTSK